VTWNGLLRPWKPLWAHGIIQGNKCLFPPRQPEIKAQCIGNNFLVRGGDFISINCLIASKRFLRCLNFLWYQKIRRQRVIVSGKYNPLSGANPCISAS
jgi:hypothetical protein